MAGRSTARHVDADPGWVTRRFREVEARLNALQVGKLSSVPGSSVTITQLLTDPAATTDFRNTDTIVAGAGDVPFLLTLLPRDGSEHVSWHPNGGGGIHLTASAWTRVGQLLTIPAFDGQGANDLYTCEYAYYPGQRGPLGVTIGDPAEGELVTDTTPTIAGTGEPGYSVSVEVDGGSVGTVSVGVDGTWSVTVGSALSPGGHAIVATQTGAGNTSVATANFTTPAPTPPTPSVVGFTAPGSFDLPTKKLTFTLPAGTAAGDLLVMAVRGGVGAGAGELCSALSCADARMTLAFTATRLTGSQTIVESIWVGVATGASTSIVVDVTEWASLTPFATGVLTTITGANGFGAPSSVETGTTTPVVGGVAAVASVWDGNHSFALITDITPPTGYTEAGDSSNSTYSATDLALWYDVAGTASPSGTFTGEGCCVIPII